MSIAIPRLRAVRAAHALLPFLLFACADNGSTGPDDVAPVITIGGVADGGSYEPPVAITIQVAPGSYTATLNGATFVSGGVVSQPGSYSLIVNARNGLAETTEQVDFTIESFGTGDVLIVRVFDLGLGTAGAPGDAILLTDSSGADIVHALVDAGARSNTESYVRTRLQALGVDTLEFMQLTHGHADHFAGMDEVLTSAIHVRDFIYNGQQRPGFAAYADILADATANADSVIVLTALRSHELGAGTVATTITMVPPLTTYLGGATDEGSDINNGSIGTEVRHGPFRMFLTGDGEVEANNRWRLGFSSLTSLLDVLKVGHHGGNDAIFDDGSGVSNSNSAWLLHTQPEVAVISANGSSHPRQRALSKLLGQDIEVYCTHVHGEIRITVDEGGIYTVSVENGNEDQDCVPGSEANS